MLYDLSKKVKILIVEYQRDLFLAATIIMVSVISFGLGRLSAIWPEKRPISIVDTDKNSKSFESTRNPTPLSTVSVALPHSPDLPSAGQYVGSKNSTYYHYPWCSGALRIKEENKVWFQSKEEAERAGYKPAGNCDGL